jgi:cytochrome c-type biogenesis protein CcmF
VGDVGRFAVQAALVVAVYGLVVTLLGIRWTHGGFLESGRRAVVVYALMAVLAAAALFAAFLTDDYSVRFVAGASEGTQALFYKIAAFWGGHDGALLLWVVILAGYMVAGVRSLRAYPDLQAPATVTLFVIAIFFSTLLATASNPFTPLVPPPPDGQGLNPLLRNPWMAAHPPTLYLGFVGMSVPFALVVAALVTGRLDDTWIVLSRRWVIIAWMFLTLGLLFGAKWSYVVLGWGGYWAWDPVENAAFMPWLTATAWMHSIQIQERRGMLVTWNVALLLITFGLTIFGTFLVRSGVLSSIHAFAQSSIGYFFLGFLALLLIASFALLVWRWDHLHSRGTVESVVSRETAFLANNLLFLAAAVVVFIGTIFPALTEAFRGVKINVGPPYFNAVMVPISIGILLLMGIGPLLPWGRATPEQLSRNFMWPGASAVLLAVLLAALGVRDVGALLVFAMSAFVLATIVLEAARGTGIRMRRGENPALALARLVARNRRRYGGYTVHFGILVMIVGIAGSSAFATQAAATLRPGERFTAARYTIEFAGVSSREQPGIDIVEASTRVWAGNRWLGTFRPQRLFYRTQEQPMHHVAIRSSPREDLYIILSEVQMDGRAEIRVLVHPLVSWLWAGGLIIALGVLLAVLPESWRRIAPASAPVSVHAPALPAPEGSPEAS